MIAAGDAQATNVGDLVALSTQAAIVDSKTGGVYPAVERIGSGSAAAVLGAIVGFEPDYSNLNSSGSYRAASTYRVALVADAPDLIFAAPQDAVGGVVAAASVGLNVGVNLGTAGTAVPYASGMSVDSSTVAVTATLPLQIVGVTASPDQDVTSTARPAEMHVRINTHAYGAAGIVGV
jgi:hypothetical protein